MLFISTFFGDYKGGFIKNSILVKLLFITITFFSFLVVSCGEVKAEDVLKSYIDLSLRGYRVQAYDLLSIKIKNKISVSEFIDASSIYRGELKDYYVIDSTQNETKKIIRYEIIVMDPEGKEAKLKNIAILILEKGKWKILDPGF